MVFLSNRTAKLRLLRGYYLFWPFFSQKRKFYPFYYPILDPLAVDHLIYDVGRKEIADIRLNPRTLFREGEHTTSDQTSDQKGSEAWKSDL